MPPPFTHLDETREPIGPVFSCFRFSSAANAVRLMLDLTGLLTLLDAAASAKRNGGRLTIANCPPIVPRMLALLRLEDALEIEAAPRSAGALARSHHSAEQWTDAEWI